MVVEIERLSRTLSTYEVLLIFENGVGNQSYSGSSSSSFDGRVGGDIPYVKSVVGTCGFVVIMAGSAGSIASTRS